MSSSSTVRDSEGFLRAVRSMLWFAIAIVFIAGAVFGGLALFVRYTGQFARLHGDDVYIAQELYNDTIARQLKDTLLQQQINALEAELAAEIPVREAGYWELFWAINNETAARIAEETPLYWLIANETEARIVADTFIAEEIANLTAFVVSLEQYRIFSEQKFAVILQNITTLDAELTLETAERIAKDLLLTENGALADATIAYLTMSLAKEIHNRTIQDVLIDEWIAALQGGGSYVTSINNQSGIANNINFISANNYTTITAPAAGQVYFTNNAIRTFNGIAADGADNIVVTVGPSLNIVYSAPHVLNIYATTAPVGPNIVTLTGFSTNGGSGFNYPAAMDGAPDANFITVPCMFQSFNGNTCGWSAPDTGTYLVQVSVVLSVFSSPDGPGSNPSAVQYALALSRGTYINAISFPLIKPEPTGVLDGMDTCHFGNWEAISNYSMDLALGATAIVQGAGQDTTPCFPFCGLSVAIFLKGYTQVSHVSMITAKYTVTKLLAA